MPSRRPFSPLHAQSLRQHLINWLFKPLLALLLISSGAGYFAALHLANQSYDRVLIERAHLLTSRLALLPPNHVPSVAELLPDASGPDLAEHLSFQLFAEDGQPLVGNAPLARPYPISLPLGVPKLSNTHLPDGDARLLALRFTRHNAKANKEYILVMAEPAEDRLFLGRSIVANIVVPQFFFVLITVFAVWFGLKRGVAPLETLRRTVAARRGDDLRPLNATMAPDEIRPLILEINALIKRQKNVLDGQQRFIANAAHQLRTPFAGLQAQAELAKREASSELQTTLAGICESSNRCSRLVNQLLSLARNEPTPSDTRTDWVDLNAVAADTARDWVNAALRKNIDLGFEGAGHPLMLLGNATALRDLISNLLDNAICYTPEGGHVTLRTATGNQLSVEDDGIGVPEDERERIFDRFYRVAGTGQSGSGLGLAIVKEVVQNHHGSLSVGPGPGGVGTLFTVRLGR